MSDFLAEFLTDIGFEGAETGADIVRLLGVGAPTLQQRFGKGIDPLFGTVRKGLGELPALLATLTGQTQRRFQTARAGLEERGVEIGRGGRAAVARAGFAGAGAIPRREQIGRRQLGQQFMGVLGTREAGMFGAEQRVETERAGLLGSLGGGIQNLLNALIAGGVEFGGGYETYVPGEPPTAPVVGPQPPEEEYYAEPYRRYIRDGGDMTFEEWIAAGRPA